jgi:quaternary ammonium compound-resistance protein SugE
MPWLLLLLAGLFEVAWAIGLKYTDGFSRPLPTPADPKLFKTLGIK